MKQEAKELVQMSYDQLKPGEELPVVELVVDDDLQGRYVLAVQDESPWYYKDSPWGGPITHPSTLAGSTILAARARYDYPFGWVHARQETEFINPLPLGKRVKVISKIIEKYRKRDKGYIVVESLLVDQDGIEIMRLRQHGMIDDERIREAAKTGLKHRPPPASERFQKKS